MDAVRETLDSIYDVDIIVAESEMEGCQSLLSMYDKIEMITENYNGDSENLGDFSIIQEGERFDAWKKDVKKQNEGKSTLNKIIFTIPRMIMSLFRLITGKLKKIDKSTTESINNEINNNTEYKSAVTKFIDGIKQPNSKAGTIAKTILAALVAAGGAALGVAGGKKIASVIKERNNMVAGTKLEDKWNNLMKADEKDSDYIKKFKLDHGDFNKVFSKAKEGITTKAYVNIMNELLKTCSAAKDKIMAGSKTNKNYKSDIKFIEKYASLAVDRIDNIIFPSGKKPDDLMNDKNVNAILSKILDINESNGRSGEIEKITSGSSIQLSDKELEHINEMCGKIDRVKSALKEHYDELTKDANKFTDHITKFDDIINNIVIVHNNKIKTGYNPIDISTVFNQLTSGYLYINTGEEDYLNKYKNVKSDYRYKDIDKCLIKNNNNTHSLDKEHFKNFAAKTNKSLLDMLAPDSKDSKIEIEKLSTYQDKFTNDMLDLSEKQVLIFDKDSDNMFRKCLDVYRNKILVCVSSINVCIINYICHVMDILKEFFYITKGGKVYTKTAENKEKVDKKNAKFDEKSEKLNAKIEAKKEKKAAKEAAKKNPGESSDESEKS